MQNPESIWSQNDEIEIQNALSKYDIVLKKFAYEIGGQLESNYHNHASRRILIECNDSIYRQVELGSVNSKEENKTNNPNWQLMLVISAWKDYPKIRRYWSKTVAHFAGMPEAEQNIQILLSNTWKIVLEIKEADLSGFIDRS
jgi:hypothetical protein